MTTPLDQRIFDYQYAGWILLSRSDTTAQLRKPKDNTNCVFVAILLLLGILPGVFYLIVKMAERDETALLVLDPQGAIHDTHQGGPNNALLIAFTIISVLFILFVFACIIIFVVSNGHPSSSVPPLIS